MEQRAEETESREGRGSLGSLRRFKSVSFLNLLPASSHAGSCLPLSGLQAPKEAAQPSPGGRPAGHHDSGMFCLLPAASFPGDTDFLFFVFLVFLFLPRRKSGTFAMLRSLKNFFNCLVFNHSTMAQ